MNLARVQLHIIYSRAAQTKDEMTLLLHHFLIPLDIMPCFKMFGS